VREYALEWIPMTGTAFTTERKKAVSEQSQEVLAVVTHTGPSLCDDQ
jgi:hypothetical protein